MAEISCTADDVPCACLDSDLFDLIGRKYAMEVVCIVANHGPVRFGEIESHLPDASTSTLSSATTRYRHAWSTNSPRRGPNSAGGWNRWSSGSNPRHCKRWIWDRPWITGAASLVRTWDDNDGTRWGYGRRSEKMTLVVS